jgi:biotin synthase-like enzyme
MKNAAVPPIKFNAPDNKDKNKEINKISVLSHIKVSKLIFPQASVRFKNLYRSKDIQGTNSVATNDSICTVTHYLLVLCIFRSDQTK